jgi:hypothetical protein
MMRTYVPVIAMIALVGFGSLARAQAQLSGIDGEFNRSLQHIQQTSQLASDRARSFSAFRLAALRWR